MNTLEKKARNIVEKITNVVVERDEIVKMAILALLSGESIFLLGPPGVGKSLVSRLITSSIKGGKNFEYLMNRFSTPEEIFGPISLKKLDEDKYERKIEGYLPTANIAFLDEIWKASPSIQNTLLTIINEKIFKNGTKTLKVPLQLLISASNELPTKGEGLEALFDRFLIRLHVDNVFRTDAFKKLITSSNSFEFNLTEDEKFSINEINQIKESLNSIRLSGDSLEFIVEFKSLLESEFGENAPYISDRRWKKIINLLRASAFVSGRNNINAIDLILIPDLIWDEISQIDPLSKFFFDLWFKYILTGDVFNFEKIENKIDEHKQFYNIIISKKEVMENKIKKPFENEEQDYFEFITADGGTIYSLPVKYDSVKNRVFPDNSVNNPHYFKKELNDKKYSKSINYLIGEFIFHESSAQYFFQSELITPIGNMSVFTKEDEDLNNTIEISNLNWSDLEKVFEFAMKIENTLEYKKDNLLSKVNSINAPLVHNFPYYQDLLSSKLDQKIEAILKKKNNLIDAIKFVKKNNLL